MMSSRSVQSSARSYPAGADIISNLPVDLIECILGYLPLRDAVKTSALSRWWRYVGLKLPKLTFDHTFGEVKAGVTTNDRLLLRMYQVLLVHKGPIHEFILSIPGLRSCVEIDHLVNVASGKGLQSFVLEFHHRGTSHHTLHSSVFSCLGLTRLCLRGCNIKPPPSFIGFSNLVYLTLGGVLITADELSNLIAQSPLLEYLYIDGSVGCDMLVVKSPKLKSLHCAAHFKTLIRVVAPALVNVLMISDLPRGTIEAKHKVLENVSFLDPVRYLALDLHYVKILLISAGLNFKFTHLRVLNLHGINFLRTIEVKCTLLLIINFPALQKIRIDVTPGHFNVTTLGMGDLEFYKGFKENFFLSCRLREVDMRNITGSWAELEFMRLLLSKLQLLETMHFQTYSMMVTDGGLAILKEVIRFPRASPRAIVKCNDQK